jgi:hypothetical protein
MATFKHDLNTSNEKIEVVTVLQNIEILSVEQQALEAVPVGQSTNTDPAQANAATGKIPDDVKTHPGGNTAVLLVDPEQAQLLVGVEAKADAVWLVQRSAGDHAPVDLVPADINVLIPESAPRATPTTGQ